jgi:hypothetical protein
MQILKIHQSMTLELSIREAEQLLAAIRTAERSFKRSGLDGTWATELRHAFQEQITKAFGYRFRADDDDTSAPLEQPLMEDIEK